VRRYAIILERTFSYDVVRTHTVFTVLLSFDAPYRPLLDMVDASVAQHLGGMVIAEGIFFFGVTDAILASRRVFAFTGDHPRLASTRHRSSGARLFSRLRHHLRYT
jgi:hypothetical protein